MAHFRAHRRLLSQLKKPFLRRRLRAEVRAASLDAPLRIVVGASGISQPGWIATERESLDLLNESDWLRAFGDRQISAILAEHVWEHLQPEHAVLAAKNCWRFLEPGGHLRVAVPDGLHTSPEYIRRVDVGGSGPAAWDHKVLYDYHSFSRVFEQAGFAVQLLEYWDENGAFNYVDWDPADGLVRRSKRFYQPRKPLPFTYTSLILDARKPA